MPKPPPHVTIARFDLWQVKGADAHAALLKGLGFRRKSMFGSHYEAAFDPALDFEGMAMIARMLIDAGLAFSGGPDWSPSEVVQDLRDRNLLSNPFDEIVWKSPGDWLVRASG